VEEYPFAWHGQFMGHFHDPTIILEAINFLNLWISHCNFGMPGSQDDTNDLQRYCIFARLENGIMQCTINGHNYDMS
jgi:hypothetical protein